MKSNRQLYIFLVKCATLYLVWSVFYYAWLIPHTRVQMWITSSTTAVSTWLLTAFDGTSEFTYVDIPPTEDDLQSYSIILMDGQGLLSVADSCNALTLMVLFAGFILAYPGDWRFKIMFIIVGCLAVFLINLVRVQVLVYNYLYYRETFDFNHKYTFTIAVYLCVFYFWMLWANKYSKIKIGDSKNLAV